MYQLPVSRRRLLCFLSLASSLFLVRPAIAVDWSMALPIAENVSVLPPSGAGVAEYSSIDGFAKWYVVYEFAGDVYLAKLEAGVWQVSPLVAGPNESVSPSLSEVGGLLHFVWQDDRSGQDEVWTRTWDGGTWSVDECLSCGEAAPDISPSFAGFGDSGLVSWEREGDIVVRELLPAGWQTETVFPGAPHASSPVVDVVDADWAKYIAVAWLDRPDGNEDIFYATKPFGWSVRRLTSTPADEDPASVHVNECCLDFSAYPLVLAHSADSSMQLSQFWGANSGDTYQFPLADDISVHGFPLPVVHGCIFGGPVADFFVGRTEGANAFLTHHREQVDSILDETQVSSNALSKVLVHSEAGEPSAANLALWIEDISGVPTLVASEAYVPGCARLDVARAPSFIIAPQGYPQTFEFVNPCGGPPWVAEYISIDFLGTLVEELTFAEEQMLPPYELFPFGGDTLSIMGGGCATGVVLEASCSILLYEGVKSPDIDGSCTVTSEDREYVTSLLGTSDFCADIDGSGLVDMDDVAIVDAHMGTACPQTASAPDPLNAGELGLIVSPNPTQGPVQISLRAPSPTSVHVSVYDVSGRQLADLGRVFLADAHPIRWDLRNSAGRPVGSGLYWVRMRTELGDTMTRTVVVLD